MLDFSYKVIRSARRTVCIQIKGNEVIVRAPFYSSEGFIERFVSEKKDFVKKHLKRNKDFSEVEKLSPKDIETARHITAKTTAIYAEFYSEIIGVTYKNIRIKKMKTVWGSCSQKKNLNFNLLLSKTPDFVIRYVVVHELCHLKEMNHSKRFWNLVKNYFPDYKNAKSWLKENGRGVLNLI